LSAKRKLQPECQLTRTHFLGFIVQPRPFVLVRKRLFWYYIPQIVTGGLLRSCLFQVLTIFRFIDL
jgi:hypothetical protein